MEKYTGDIRTNEAPGILDHDQDKSPVYDTSTVILSSPVPSDQVEQLTDTQSSNASTITLSSPERTVSHWEEGQDISTTTCNTKAEKECQTIEGVYLSNDEYESLLKKASFCPNFQNDLLKITLVVSKMAQPEMNPDAFEKLCKDAGAENLYHCIKDAICHERMSNERKHLSGIRTMVIIYIMMFSRSQKSNSFQVALSRTLQQFGISNEGIQSLRNLGIAAHRKQKGTDY